MIQPAEMPWLYAGLACYGLALLVVVQGVLASSGQAAAEQLHRFQRWRERMVLASLACGVLLLLVAMAVRWQRIDHGPFVSLFELLISQTWSLGLVFAVTYWRFPSLRPSAVVVLPAIWILGAWILFLEPDSPPFPPTYYNPWLWAHVGFGKFFLAFSLVGSGLAGVLLFRRQRFLRSWFAAMPDERRIDALAWRFMLLAFIFHSLMLIAGGVWAQDAWGRYWAWDALETSSFRNWLLLGAALHLRLTYRIRPQVAAIAILVIFVFAFLTYFGAPFYSEAAHKGVI